MYCICYLFSDLREMSVVFYFVQFKTAKLKYSLIISKQSKIFMLSKQL